MRFKYELRRSEYEDYYKCKILKSKEMKKLQHRAWLIVPVLAAILLIGFRPRVIWWYLGAIVVSLVWLQIVNWRVAVRIKQGAKHEVGKLTPEQMQRITVEIDENSFSINTRREMVKNYLLFSNLVIVFLGDNSDVILPERIFEGDEEKLRTVLRWLQSQADANKGAGTPEGETEGAGARRWQKGR